MRDRGAYVALNDPHGVDVLTIGDRTYAIATEYHGDAVSLIEIHGNGTMEQAGMLAAGDGGAVLQRPDNVAAFKIGAAAYALVGSASHSAVQLIRIYDDGSMAPAGYARRGVTAGFEELSHPAAIRVFDMGGSTYALVTSTDRGGFSPSLNVDHSAVHLIEIVAPPRVTEVGIAAGAAAARGNGSGGAYVPATPSTSPSAFTRTSASRRRSPSCA